MRNLDLLCRKAFRNSVFSHEALTCIGTVELRSNQAVALALLPICTVVHASFVDTIAFVPETGVQHTDRLSFLAVTQFQPVLESQAFQPTRQQL